MRALEDHDHDVHNIRRAEDDHPHRGVPVKRKGFLEPHTISAPDLQINAVGGPARALQNSGSQLAAVLTGSIGHLLAQDLQTPGMIGGNALPTMAAVEQWEAQQSGSGDTLETWFTRYLARVHSRVEEWVTEEPLGDPRPTGETRNHRWHAMGNRMTHTWEAEYKQWVRLTFEQVFVTESASFGEDRGHQPARAVLAYEDFKRGQRTTGSTRNKKRVWVGWQYQWIGREEVHENILWPEDSFSCPTEFPDFVSRNDPTGLLPRKGDRVRRQRQ